MKVCKTTAFIRDGKPLRRPDADDKIRKFFRENEGKEILEMRKPAEENRSDAQNKFFHAVIWPAAQRALMLQNEQRAWDKTWVKEVYLKKTFLVVNPGTPDEYVRHTSDLGVKEFWKFICQCLVLIESIGGDLNAEESEEYQRIVAKYKLETHISDAITYGV